MSTTTILLADDHQLMRQGLRSMLEEQPELQVVGEAENGRAAVEMTRQLQPDVVIMDVTMPDLNGIDATRQICDSTPNSKVIGLSMHRERQFVMQMLAASAVGYLLKDSPLEELLGAIEAVVQGEVFLSSRVTGLLLDECAGGAVAAHETFSSILTPRERQVLQLISEGLSAKEIGQTLQIASKIVGGHRRQIMDKLKLYSIAERTRYPAREGMSSPE